MQSHLLITLLLISFISFTSAVTDENICDTQCQFCCREKVCRSEDECKGNFSPFIILGAVAGGLVGLIILRKLYVYLKGKNPQPKEGNGRNRSRSRSRNTRPKKEKKETKPLNKSDKSNKTSKASKARSREDVSQKPEEVYLQIDNESIVGVDSNKPDQEQNKKNLLPDKGVSKGEISSKSRLEADEKGNTQRTDRKRESSAPKGKTSSTKPSSGKPGTSSGKSTTKKPATGSKPGSSKPGTSGERGRSTGPGGKDRASSQPKKSAGTSVEKGKAPIKKNQI